MRRLVLLIPLALLGLYAGGAFASISRVKTTTGLGTIASLSSTSITVGRHRDARTCALTTSSPATGSFATGERVKIVCANGVLVAIADLSGYWQHWHGHHHGRRGDHPHVRLTVASGPIGRLDSTSITVQMMSCRLGAGSPSTSGFQVGDAVQMECVNGVLDGLTHVDPPPTTNPTTTTGSTAGTTTTTTGTTTTTTGTTTTTTGTTTTTTGTTTTGTTTTGTTTTTGSVTSMNAPIAALSSSSITVGTLSCQIGAGSPPTSAFKVGDVVIISCTNGTLSTIALDSF